MQNTTTLTASFLRKSLLACSALALAACGGGETSRAATFVNFANEYGDLLDNAVFAGTRNDPATLPSSGSATHNGVMSLQIFGASETIPDGDLFVLGDFRVTTDFATDKMDGDIVALVDSDGDSYSGSVDIEADVLNNAGPDAAAVFGTADGEFRNDRTGDLFLIDGIDDADEAFFVADFFGPGQQYLLANIRGELVTPDGTLLIWDNDAVGTPDGNVVIYAEE